MTQEESEHTESRSHSELTRLFPKSAQEFWQDRSSQSPASSRVVTCDTLSAPATGSCGLGEPQKRFLSEGSILKKIKR